MALFRLTKSFKMGRISTMQKRENFLPFFITFFVLSLLFILLGTTGIFGDIESIFNKAMGPGKSVAYIFTLKELQYRDWET